MKIRINGEWEDIPSARALTLAELLAQRHGSAESLAVAVNAEFVPRGAHAQHSLCEGDDIEIVAPQAGG